MCGIVGVIVDCDVVLVLIEGLKWFEYCGYDFLGIVVIDYVECFEVCCVCCIG